jgi:hypothetical protein
VSLDEDGETKGGDEGLDGDPSAAHSSLTSAAAVDADFTPSFQLTGMGRCCYFLSPQMLYIGHCSFCKT